MSNFTMVEGYPTNKKGTIAIRPYFDPSVINMGLERYNQCLFENVFHEEELACVEINGVKRFITGLNEFAPDVQAIENTENKEAKIEAIRAAVVQLEKELAQNVIDPTDVTFWNQVKLVRPDNYEFWSKIKIRAGNDPVFLDPKDPYDRIKIMALEAGGFSMVAKDYEACRTAEKPLKFYLDKEAQTASIRTELKKLRNKALAELQKLFEKGGNKLMYVAKVLDFNSAQYRKTTPPDVMYENLDRIIWGDGTDTNKRRSAELFIEAVGSDMETLKLRAIIKDALYHKILDTHSSGQIMHLSSGIILGRNPASILEYFKNPANEDILKTVQNQVESTWV